MWECYPNDFELIYYCMQNDEWALRVLIQKYTPYARKIVKESLNGYKALDMYREDFTAEALLAIIDSIYCYKDQKECKFGTFYYRCAMRRVRTLLRHHLRENNLPNLYSVSLDTIPTEDESCYLDRIVAIEDNRNPEYYLNFKEKLLKVRETINNLSDLDKKVLDLYMEEVPYAEASELIGKSAKTYDNHVQKIKKLIKSTVYDE